MSKEPIFGGNVPFQVHGMYSEHDYFYSNCFFTPEKRSNIYLWKFSNILGNWKLRRATVPTKGKDTAVFS